ncbi:hypothetical protein GCM10027423_26030 [Spirosoma arcticum]
MYFRTKSQQTNVLMVSDQVVTGVKLILDKTGTNRPFPHTLVLPE